MNFLKNGYKFLACLIFGVFFLSGCATTNNNLTHDPKDPLESYNRKMHAFNMELDKLFFRPVAVVYDTFLPWPIKKGINNFFSNVGEVPTVANDILQTNFYQATSDSARFVFNSIIGIGGLFDVASKMGLEKNYEDFGITLVKWGAKDSAYFVIPILGPSTLRDLWSLPVNYFGLSVWGYVRPMWIGYAAIGVRYVDTRASLLAGDKMLEQAFDPYAFIRDAYLQRRLYLMDENAGAVADVGGGGDIVTDVKEKTNSTRQKRKAAMSKIVSQ
ncbi:MAG: VacJ family lipoprotein [Gammaproteobacteria bacterium]|nr:VacJ family lipoprotein [Gammaproteobacteria bacterium]